MEFASAASEAVLASAPDVVAATLKAVMPVVADGVHLPPAGMHPILGTLPAMVANINELYDYNVQNMIELQDLPDYKGCFQYVGPTKMPYLHITDPELVQFALDKAESHPGLTANSDELYDVLSGAFGTTSIFMATGKVWAFRRKYYSHLFSLRSLREVMLPQFEINASKIKARIDSLVAKGSKEFDVQDIFSRATLDAIGQIAFAQDLGCLDSDEAPHFMQHFDRTQDVTFKRAVDPTWKIKRFLQIGFEKEFADSMTEVNNTIYKLLADRAAGKYRKEQFTILNLFEAKAKKEGQTLTMEMLRDICWDFLIAGRDTTAVASTWLLYFMIKHPDVCAKVREEFKGKDLTNCDVLLYQLPYLTACCFEAQRLKPSVPSDLKGVTKDFTLPNGLEVKAGMSLGFSPYQMGRNPKLWGDDVLEFKPERWLDDNNEVRSFSEGKFPHFNGGPRLCLGKTMALLEIKNMMAHLLPRYDFEFAEDRPIAYKLSIIMWVKGGMWVRARRRTEGGGDADAEGVGA